MKILVLNCGSSSIKYMLIQMQSNETLASGVVEKIGLKGSFLKHTKQDGQKVMLEGEILEHQLGIEYVLGILLSEKHGCLKSLNEIDAIGHRVVHGGEKFNSSVLITNEVVEKMEECIDLAPLHNPPNLKGIYAMKDLLPTTPQVGVFDTAFHQTMPDFAYMYAIPFKLYNKYGIRRYGFHGTSHRFVSARTADFLGEEYKNLKIITCHLGNGGSIAAIDKGVSVDTSMGFTPVEGLVMGTRAGDLDIGAVTYIMEKEVIGPRTANTLFNKHSGLLGISGISSDMREVRHAALEEGNPKAILAIKSFQYRIKKYIGSYIAAMNGVDALVFTGGIGENSHTDRMGICSDMEFLGITIDEAINNATHGEEAIISKKDSKVKVCVIPTNEEWMIAKDTMTIVETI